MHLEVIRAIEAPVARFARERFLFQVRREVALEVFHPSERLVAYSTNVELVFAVGQLVAVDVGLAGVALAAESALE